MQVALLGNWKNNQQMTNFIAQKLLADESNGDIHVPTDHECNTQSPMEITSLFSTNNMKTTCCFLDQDILVDRFATIFIGGEGKIPGFETLRGRFEKALFSDPTMTVSAMCSRKLSYDNLIISGITTRDEVNVAKKYGEVLAIIKLQPANDIQLPVLLCEKINKTQEYALTATIVAEDNKKGTFIFRITGKHNIMLNEPVALSKEELEFNHEYSYTETCFGVDVDDLVRVVLRPTDQDYKDIAYELLSNEN